jgi:hypothetical protein
MKESAMKEIVLDDFIVHGDTPGEDANISESAAMNQEAEDAFDRPETPSDAILRSKDFANEKLQMQLTLIREQLCRRNILLGEMRLAYLRDVVVIKSELLNRDHLRDKYNPSEALKVLPSLDLRRSLHVFAPDDCFFNIEPCEKCGGRFQLEHVQVCG